MATPNAIIVKEHGTNCEDESKFAFERAGARADIVHMEDLIRNKNILENYQIMMFPGGFSYGDDMGSAMAWANRIRNHLWEEVRTFVGQDKLVLGICNGFQNLANLGLVPALDGKYGEPQVALMHNDSARYDCRWVDLEFTSDSPWLIGLEKASWPIAHGEGKFYATPETLKKIKEKGLVAARYIKGEICSYQNLPGNPNGSLDDIAGITDESKRILGMMPHPERAIEFTHLPDWTVRKEIYRRVGAEIPREASGIQIFKNGVNYFK